MPDFRLPTFITICICYKEEDKGSAKFYTFKIKTITNVIVI